MNLKIKFYTNKTIFTVINDHLQIKTKKYMNDDFLALQMYQELINMVNEFKYLGNIISNKGSNKHNIKQRIKLKIL